MEDDPTPNELSLMRLLNFKRLAELNQWLNQPDNLEALAHMGAPEEYDEAARAEQESEMVEELERLYSLSSPRLNGPS